MPLIDLVLEVYLCGMVKDFREEKEMKFKIRENNNYELITFKHKIALQAMNMIEDKDITLYSEVLLYAQLSFVQESCEEDVIDFLNNSMEKDLLTLMETVIEPVFMEIMKDEKAKNAFDEVMDILSDYLYNKRESERSFGGIIEQLVGFLTSLSDADFNILFQRGQNVIKTVKEKPKAEKQVEIQNAKMEELINKFKNVETTK